MLPRLQQGMDHRMIPQIITKVNPSKEEKIASNGLRHIVREPLCMIPFTPTPEQIKIWNETYKDLYSLMYKN
jgi:hypothetical protein